MNGEILTPASPRWHDFMLILTGPEYLDFQLVPPPLDQYILGYGYMVKDGIAWFCEESKHKPFAREVLASFGGVDVDGTLAQWPDLCDCELVFSLGNEEEE